MGGLRTAGDLVARMQLTRRMRIPEAKAYVADKLGVGTTDLSDPVAMTDVRRELGLGLLGNEEVAGPEDAIGIQAKVNIGAHARRARALGRTLRRPHARRRDRLSRARPVVYCTLATGRRSSAGRAAAL